MKGYSKLTMLGLAMIMGSGLKAQVLYLANGTDLYLGNSQNLTLAGGCKVNSGTADWDATLYVKGGTIEGNLKLKKLVVDGGNTTTIHSGNTLVSITGGVNVTGNSTLVTGGNLSLLSNAAGTARIEALAAGNSISGDITVQQYIPGGRRAYRFLSHPFNAAMPLSVLTDNIDITGAGGAANGFTPSQTNAASAWWLNPAAADTSTQNANSGWVDFQSADSTAWGRYQGIYLMVRGAKGEGLVGQNYTPSAVTLDMKGAVNQGQQVIPVAMGPNSGYNLIGNPYPSAVDLIPALNAMSHKNGTAFWVWNTNLGQKGAYETVLYSATSYHLPANSAFMVDVTNNTSITFQESHKVATGMPLFKHVIESDLVELKVYSDSGKMTWDNLYLRSNAAASDSLEQEDAKKNPNYDLNLSAYAAGGQKLCVDTRPYAPNTIIPLSFDTKLQREFEIRVTKHTLSIGKQMYLHDKYLNKTTLLQPGTSYKFFVTADSLSAGNRFQINVDQSFNKQGSASGIEGPALSVKNTAAADVKLYPNPATNEVYLEWPAATTGATIRVINSVGSVVLAGRYEGARTVLQVGHLARGVYTVVLQHEGRKEQLRFVKY